MKMYFIMRNLVRNATPKSRGILPSRCSSVFALMALLLVVSGLQSAWAETYSHKGVQETDEAKPAVYLIGNSLTWDTVPSLLDGNVQWHVDCGKSLPYIIENPENPCIESSSSWPDALKAQQYDIISIQVFYGSNMEQDVAALAKLIRLQPDADIVLHTGWAWKEMQQAEWSQTSACGDAEMSHNRVWFSALLDKVREQHPGRMIYRTKAMDALQLAADDIEAGLAPVDSLTDLFRDKIHMDLISGRYLMHNIMRQALGQGRSVVGFEKLDPEMKGWLGSILDRMAK